jgi:hypothetical protein
MIPENPDGVRDERRGGKGMNMRIAVSFMSDPPKSGVFFLIFR